MKIFGIGLSKTGTNSLVDALGVLGYKILHYPPQNIHQALEDHDGCADLPTVNFYKELDERYPGSKFILTVRNKEKWLDSIEKHFKRRPPSTLSEWGKANRVAVYGSLYPSREDFSKVYDRWHIEVFTHFSDRKEDLLRLNIVDEMNGTKTWNKLAAFVGKKAPAMAFPHGNKEPSRSKEIDLVIPYCNIGGWDSLKYAVRSFSKNFVDLGNIWVVGDHPDWANDKLMVIDHHVEYNKLDRIRNHNYCKSMLIAAMYPEVTEHFLYAADDHYLLAPRTANDIRDTVMVREELGAYNQLQRRTAKPGWQTMIWDTADKLMDAGLNTWNYETHTPKLIEKTQLISCMAYFGYGDGNLIWQTAYFNFCPPDNVNAVLSEVSPLKAGFYEPTTAEEIKEKADAAIYLNHNDDGETAELRTYIEQRFPTPSKYEKV